MRLTQGCFSFLPDLTDEQIEKQSNAQVQPVADSNMKRNVNVAANEELVDSSDESDGSDLELIEEDFEDEPGKDEQQPQKEGGEKCEIEKNTNDDEVKKVDTLINSYLDNLVIKRENWEVGRDGKKVESKDKNRNQYEISREAVVAKVNKAPERRRYSRSCKRTANYSEFF